MKRINAYKKLFNVEGEIELKSLKNTYRGLMKEWHPDKFQDKDKIEEASEKSQEIIGAYEFLVSIAPETKEANMEEYTELTTNSAIADFHHKSLLFEVSFVDGPTYEYFGVDKKLYSKFVNSNTQYRFAKRNIFHSFTYRKSKKDAAVD